MDNNVPVEADNQAYVSNIQNTSGLSKNELKLMNIYDVARSCNDLALMLKQQRYIGGFIPLSNWSFSEYKTMNKCIKSKELCLDPIHLHYLVKKHKLPNFLGARIQVNFDLSLDLLDSHLEEYWDWQLQLFMRYGFSMNFQGKYENL